MADAVTVRNNGFAEMAYVGDKPWHGLGQELQPGLGIDEWKKAAGMDWRVQRAVVRYALDATGESYGIMDDKHVLLRSDTKQPLGLVSKKYQVVQPESVLEFFRDLTEANGYQLNTAGTLFDGRRFWALADTGAREAVRGDDEIGGFLLLSSSCDGTLATTARFTTVRVVCNNTLGMALSGKAKREVVVRHTSKFDAKLAKEQLGCAKEEFGTFLGAARKLADKSISHEAAGKFVGDLLTDSKFVTMEKVEASQTYRAIMQLFEGRQLGMAKSNVDGSAWGLVNAVTQYIDHDAKAKTPAHRITSAWFGRGDDLKTMAFERLLEA